MTLLSCFTSYSLELQSCSIWSWAFSCPLSLSTRIDARIASTVLIRHLFITQTLIARMRTESIDHSQQHRNTSAEIRWTCDSISRTTIDESSECVTELENEHDPVASDGSSFSIARESTRIVFRWDHCSLSRSTSSVYYTLVHCQLTKNIREFIHQVKYL